MIVSVPPARGCVLHTWQWIIGKTLGIFNLIIGFIAVIFLGFLIALFMLPILGDIHHYIIPNSIFHNDLIDEVDVPMVTIVSKLENGL